MRIIIREAVLFAEKSQPSWICAGVDLGVFAIVVANEWTIHYF